MEGMTLSDVGIGQYVDTEPNPRFPVWTRGNAGEVYPEVFYPLSWSTASAAGEAAMRRAAMRSGLLTEKDLEGQEFTMTGVFAGYSYLNLSVQRVVARRMIGATVDDVDDVFLGNSDLVPPYEPAPGDRNLLASLRGLRHVMRILGTTELPELEADQQRVQRWKDSLPRPADASLEYLRHVTDRAMPMFEDLFERHLYVSGAAAIPVGALAKQCEEQLGDRSLHMTLLGGIGDVDSAAPSWALWELGRLVADDGNLTEVFDAGLGGLHERLVADPTATDFLAALGTFQERFGARGPNEWETACETWGTDPSLVLALVDRLRLADDDQAPGRQQARLAAEREALTAELEGRLSRLQRWSFRRNLRAAHLWSQSRERTKTTVIVAIHEMRLASREFGRRCAERAGGDARPDDVWFLLSDEMDDYMADPAAFAPVVAARRKVREELSTIEPPFAFSGERPSVDTWLRRDRTTETVGTGTVIEGIAGCPGVARGRARVVTSPLDPTALEPGDVLVAPITDPSWTPLFMPAAAVVVDVGAELSHAIIVSRELGIPCVVSATEATRRLPDGAMVEVDGTHGTVTVLEG